MKKSFIPGCLKALLVIGSLIITQSCQDDLGEIKVLRKKKTERKYEPEAPPPREPTGVASN